MCDVVQSKSVAGIVVHTVLCNAGFVVPVAERIGKLADIAVQECELRNFKETVTATTGADLFSEHTPPRLTRLLKKSQKF